MNLIPQRFRKTKNIDLSNLPNPPRRSWDEIQEQAILDGINLGLEKMRRKQQQKNGPNNKTD